MDRRYKREFFTGGDAIDRPNGVLSHERFYVCRRGLHGGFRRRRALHFARAARALARAAARVA